MNIKTLKASVVIAVAALAAGCAVVGHKFDPQVVDTFVPGVTTKEEAITKMGKPVQSQTNDEGEERIQWKHVVGTPLGAKGDMIILAFDKDGKFKRVTRKGNTSTY